MRFRNSLQLILSDNLYLEKQNFAKKAIAKHTTFLKPRKKITLPNTQKNPLALHQGIMKYL